MRYSACPRGCCAPWHYNSTIGGEPAMKMDDLPLEWFHSDGVKLDGRSRAVEKDEPGIFWEAHQCDLQYSQIERLVNLGALPPTSFQVSCFPLNIQGASGAPARVVAHVSDA